MNENSPVSVKIDILDYPADKYLNIDRTNLKENSFEFSELLKSETTAFSEFCKMIINQSRNLSNEELLIFTILFYRFVEKNSFNQFYEKNKDNINSLNIIIGDTHIKLMDIYDMKKKEILLYEEIDVCDEYDESSYNKEKFIRI